MVRKFFLFLLIVIIPTMCTTVVSCQKDKDDTIDDTVSTGNIKGTVVDYETNNPVPNALLSLSPSGMSMISGNDGAFVFEGLEPGQYTIITQAQDYQTNRKLIDVKAGQDTPCVITIVKQ